MTWLGSAAARSSKVPEDSSTYKNPQLGGFVHSKMLFELLKNAKKVAATKPKASSTTKPADKSTKDKKDKK